MQQLPIDAVLAVAKSDAAFDGRDWDGMPRADRQRYKDRAAQSVRAAMPHLQGTDNPVMTKLRAVSANENVAWLLNDMSDDAGFPLRAVFTMGDLRASLRPHRRYRHARRNGVFEVIGEAFLNAADLDLLKDRSVMTLYRSEDGSYEVREKSEFGDGRFIEIEEAR